MRLRVTLAALVLSANAAWADANVDRLVDAMGLPALVEVFAIEGQESAPNLNAQFLNGQGGDILAQTVRDLYDPARLEQELRAGMIATLDGDMAAQALLFFESDLGARIVDLEVQARRAMMDERLEEAAQSAPSANSDAITGFLGARTLVERNTNTTITARTAFFEGMAMTAPGFDAPDIEALRDTVAAQTERWLRGYYALAHSPLSADDVAIYTAFWNTDVGQALDDALFDTFGDSYATLSFGLGQMVGRLLPQNDL